MYVYIHTDPNIMNYMWKFFINVGSTSDVSCIVQKGTFLNAFLKEKNIFEMWLSHFCYTGLLVIFLNYFSV